MSQTIDSVKALAKFLGLSDELPEKIALANNSQLTLSCKRDFYYYTSLDGCSCPAGIHNKICRHRRDLSQATREAAAKVNSGLELFGHTAFKPVLE